MAEHQQPLVPSLLDRLVEGSMYGAKQQPWYGLDDMMQAVQRDLEALLNTRGASEGVVAGLPEVQASLVCYGLPDLASVNGETLEGRRQVCAIIENVVRKYEPRLKDIRASLLPSTSPFDRDVRFRIEGRLSVDPAPDVVFDTTLELSTGQYKVQSVEVE
jgi:type VI secretion system protein ImpF